MILGHKVCGPGCNASEKGERQGGKNNRDEPFQYISGGRGVARWGRIPVCHPKQKLKY
jgi:hypothetical protein